MADVSPTAPLPSPAPGSAGSDTTPAGPVMPVVLARPPRAGELTPNWRIVTVLTWVGVALALASIWNASRQLGLATWWLGARAQPQARAVQISPFVPPVLMMLGAINNARRLAWFGLAASAVIAVYGVFDVSRVTRIGVVELVVAGAAAAISLASLTGTYRRLGGGDGGGGGGGGGDGGGDDVAGADGVTVDGINGQHQR